MSDNGIEIINIDPGESGDRPVVINNESGSIVTINFNTRNSYHYALPEWVNQDSIIAIIKSVRG